MIGLKIPLMRHGIAAQYPINVESLRVTVIAMMNALEIFAVAQKIASLHHLRLQTLQLTAALIPLKVINVTLARVNKN